MRFDMIKYMVEYYKSLCKSFPVNLSFGIITNGVLLNDEIIDFLGDNRISVLYSIDGTPETTAKLRPMTNGSSSYRSDLGELLGKMKDKRISLNARVTFTPDCLNLKENIHWLIKSGFEEISFLTDMEETWMEVDDQPKLIALRKALFELSDYFLREAKSGNILNINFFKNYLAKYMVFRRNLIYQETTPCTSGRTTVGITVDGDIYPCHHWHNQFNRTQQECDYEKCRIGSLHEGIFPQRRQVFLEFSSEKIDKCRQCAARFICGGPCYALSYLHYGDIYKTFDGQCLFMKEVLTAIKYVYSTLKIENEKVLSQILNQIHPMASCCL